MIVGGLTLELVIFELQDKTHEISFHYDVKVEFRVPMFVSSYDLCCMYHAQECTQSCHGGSEMPFCVGWTTSPR